MSQLSSTSDAIRRKCASMRADQRSPPRGLAAGLPVSFSRAHQRTALAAETPKRSAACRRDMPAATADNAFSKIKRKGLLRHACQPPSPAGSLNQNFMIGNSPHESDQRRNRSSGDRLQPAPLRSDASQDQALAGEVSLHLRRESSFAIFLGERAVVIAARRILPPNRADDFRLSAIMHLPVTGKRRHDAFMPEVLRPSFNCSGVWQTSCPRRARVFRNE